MSIIKCECGCEVTKKYLSKHVKTKKHINLMNKKITPVTIKKITTPSDDESDEENEPYECEVCDTLVTGKQFTKSYGCMDMSFCKDCYDNDK